MAHTDRNEHGMTCIAQTGLQHSIRQRKNLVQTTQCHSPPAIISVFLEFNAIIDMYMYVCADGWMDV